MILLQNGICICHKLAIIHFHILVTGIVSHTTVYYRCVSNYAILIVSLLQITMTVYKVQYIYEL